MNRVILFGRLTKDIEVNTYGKGKNKGCYTNYCVAVNRPKKKGDEESECDFIYCVSFGKTAEFLEAYARKGARVLVEGALQVDSYENKNGDYCTSTKVLVNKVDLIDFIDKE